MERIKNNKIKLVSVIIPAYKQEATIVKDINRIKKVMDQSGYKYELIVVVDGKIDKTYDNAKKLESSRVIVVGYPHNHGKGYAIRYGMVRSKGDIVGFLDSGMDLNPQGLSFMLSQFKKLDADVIIGSKRHPVSKVNYPLHRKIISSLSQLYIFALFNLSVRDTQVGMKFFKRKVIENVLPRLLVKRFAFDIEILVVAYYLGYKRIYEAPIELNFNIKDSLVSKDLLRTLLRTFWDSFAIFYRLRLLRYYDDDNKRKWKYDPELKFPVNIG
ncbi:MAG: glycosyltransferase [Candidatus Levybacteria bacterium]|nr:glycosyltransferase [Candidatus Levybacteria bacterium]